MTALLQEAFQKAATLPEDIQDLVAKELLAEIEQETRWDETLANSQPLLDKLTAKAMGEYKRRK